MTARRRLQRAAMSARHPLRRGGHVGEAPVTGRRCRRGGRYGEVAVAARRRLRRGGAYSELTRWAMADFLLAAWLR